MPKKMSGDGIKSAPHGKEKGPQSEAMAGSIANGALNYNSNECAKGIKSGNGMKY